MPTRPSRPERRFFLVRIAEVAGVAAVAAIVSRSGPAAAKATKGDFLYQDHSHDGKSCDQCKFFSADGAGSDTGSCAIVSGTISRHGWCAAFSPKTRG